MADINDYGTTCYPPDFNANFSIDSALTIPQAIYFLRDKINETNKLVASFDYATQGDINTAITSIRTELTKNLASMQVYLTNMINAIEAGQVTAFDPTTGETRDINIVINTLYDFIRYYNACTAQELDAFGYTASKRDGFQLTARDFDLNNRKTYQG